VCNVFSFVTSVLWRILFSVFRPVSSSHRARCRFISVMNAYLFDLSPVRISWQFVVVFQSFRTGDEIASQIRPRPLPSTSLILVLRPIILTFFVVFLSHSRKVLGWYLKLGRDRFPPPFFSVNCSPVILPYSDTLIIWTIKKKFWEELITYFLLIRRGPHRRRRIQQFSCCLCIRCHF
jgi:hypothetical protein